MSEDLGANSTMFILQKIWDRGSQEKLKNFLGRVGVGPVQLHPARVFCR